MAFDILSKSPNAQITAAYIGFFGRAPDPAGLNFWIGEYNDFVDDALAGIDDPTDAEVTAARKTALSNVASSFAVDEEGLETYPFLQTPLLSGSNRPAVENFVTQVFQNLFNRDPKPEGLEFWADEVQERLSNDNNDFIGSVIVDIMSGAQGPDVNALQNKIDVGQDYAIAFAEAASEGAEWTTDEDIDGARAVVDGVDESPGSVTAAQGQIQQIVDEETGAITPPPSSEVKELTPNADDIDGDNASITVFQGAVGTLTTGDNLDGGTGEGDILDVSMRGGENAVPRLTEIEVVAVHSLDDGANTENTLNLNDATGVEEVQVVDKGGDSAPLAINGVESTSPTLNLTGDETIGVKVLDDTGEITEDDTVGDEVNTAVNGFNGELNLRNGIETVNLEVANGSDNAFTLSQTEAGTFEQLIVTDETVEPPADGKDDDKTSAPTPGNTVITSAVASLYDYSASAGNHTLVLTKDDPDDSVTVKGGSGEEKIDFTTTMDGVGENGHPNTVDGGDGNDQVWAQFNTPIDVQPEINNVEAIKLAFNVDGPQDATFSATDVGTDSEDQNPLYIIDESTSQVQLLDLADPATVEIIGDLSEGAVFDADDDTSIITRFVTETDEDPAIVVKGDLEYQDFDEVTIQNTDSPGFPNPPTGDGQGAVVLENQILLNEASTLTIETTSEDDDDIDNDGDIVVAGESGVRPWSAIGLSSNLAALNVNAVNGNIFLGDGVRTGQIFFGDNFHTALYDASALTDLTVNADNAIASLGDIGYGEGAGDLENVNIEGTNRGVFNLDNINAFGPDGGALIEDFNVTTAEQSQTDEDFRTNGQPITVGNDIDQLGAGLVRNMRLDLAEDGSLSFGMINSNLGEVNIFGAGDLYMTGWQGYQGNNFMPTNWIEDIQATNHTGGIMLDFRNFRGTDTSDFGSTDFEGTTNIELGDQDTIGTGIRFDEYQADIHVDAGAGDMKGSDDPLPAFVNLYPDDSAAPIVGSPGEFFGLVTGSGDDIVNAGAGEDYVFTGAGDDELNGGEGADILEGGTGFDIVDHGATSPGDEAGDISIFGEDVLNGFGRKPDDSFDLFLNFEEGSGPDVTRLYKPGFGNPTTPDPDNADMPEISSPGELSNSTDVDIFELTTDFGTVNLDAAIQNLNASGENTAETNFFSMLEAEDAVDDLSDYLFDHPEGVFALVYDNDGENVNAGLFHIQSKFLFEKGASQDTAAPALDGNGDQLFVPGTDTPYLFARNDSDHHETFTWDHSPSGDSGSFEVPPDGAYFVAAPGLPKDGSFSVENSDGDDLPGTPGTISPSTRSDDFSALEEKGAFVSEDSVQLVGVYQDVGANEMEADEFQFV